MSSNARDAGAEEAPQVRCECGVSWSGFDARKLLAHLTDHFALVHDYRMARRDEQHDEEIQQ